MSEFWKSTPNYWCKFCKTYVRDTKSERAKHEATGKHKGSVERHIRGIQKDEDQKEREKARLDNEVARLKRLAGHKVEKPAAASQAQSKPKGEPRRPTAQQASVEERIRQAESAAALGIAIPEELRPHMSLAGSWQVVETKVEQPVKEEVKKEGIKQDSDIKAEDGDAPAPRKRPADGDDEVVKPRKRGPQIYATEADKARADKEIDSLFASFGVKKEEVAEDEEKPFADAAPKAPIKFKKRTRPAATMISRESDKEDEVD